MSKIRLVILLTLVVVACKKDNKGTFSPLPAASGIPVTVTVDQAHPGNTIPSAFQGFSFDTKILTENPEFLNADNTTLVQLIKNLGPGILRVGGSSSDDIDWTGKIRTPRTTRDSLTTSDIDRLAAFSKAINWPVLFGLNLGNSEVAAAADEARYVSSTLNNSLYAFQFGNEPDVYNYGERPSTYMYLNYQAEWETYLSAVKNKVPQALFAGPDVAYNSDWFTSFSNAENRNVTLLSAHYYVAGPASNPSLNYHTILNYDFKLSYYLGVLRNVSSTYNLHYRISECNSIYGGGKPGVSDAFASALWALDFMWAAAEHNADGVNFHGGPGGYYAPVSFENNMYVAKPEYYSMLAFKYGSAGGTIIPTSISGALLCSAYTCVNPDGSYAITLINKDDTNQYAFQFQLGQTVSTVKIVRLSAPSISASTGITFADNSVNTDGTFAPGQSENYSVNQKTFVINVPAGSAAVVIVR